MNDDDDPLAGCVGIRNALLLSLPIWAAIAWLLRHLINR